MQSFSLTLPDGGQTCGLVSLPPTRSDNANVPLLVCIHGGSYDSEYFDVNEKYSVASITSSLSIPVIAVTRPGYGESTLPKQASSRDTYAQQQGKYLDSVVLPAVWKEYGEPSGATAVVILAHSIGGMMATVLAGSHAETGGYPLAGLITSGIGSALCPGPQKLSMDILANSPPVVTFPPAMKDELMLQIPGGDLVDPEMAQYTDRLNKPIPAGEYQDINVTWLQYWHKYSHNVKVPLMYGVSEFDGLWISTEEALANYLAAFPSSPRVEGEIVKSAPHCIELSHQSRAWLLKCCTFAQECAVWYESIASR